MEYLWTGQLTWELTIEMLVRLLIAGGCGIAIGFERSKRLKAAGIRTHVLVCATAALLMIVSKYAFSDIGLNELGTRGADSARIAAQAVSGISFLCAGVIFKAENHVSGLTTAASLWGATAVGLTIGAGLYLIGVLATVLVVLFQMVLHRFTFGNDSLSAIVITLRVREPFDVEMMMGPLKSSHSAQLKEDSVCLLYTSPSPRD